MLALSHRLSRARGEQKQLSGTISPRPRAGCSLQGKSILLPRLRVEFLSEEQSSSCSPFLLQSLQSIQKNEILHVEGLRAEAWRFNLL